MRRLIVTADDFGLAEPVNDAVERGHCEGILTTASLMVAAPATEDAVARAKRLPELRVGLHLVLVNGEPVLPPDRVPLLVDRDGRFPSDLFAAGVRTFFTPGIRAQLEAEIRAQFERFRSFGLRLDHVNAQNHFHVHPTVLTALLRVGREFGMRAVRVPYEPFAPSWRAMHTQPGARLAAGALVGPWAALMRARLRAAGVACNDYVFGMHDTGHMTRDRVQRYLAQLPDGVTELYLHPATHRWPEAFPASYDFAGEFQALVDPGVKHAVQTSGAQFVSFSELAHAR